MAKLGIYEIKKVFLSDSDLNVFVTATSFIKITLVIFIYINHHSLINTSF